MFSIALICIIVLAVLGYVFGVRKSIRSAAQAGVATHSLPVYYGYYVALWTGIPAVLLSLVWLLMQDSLIDGLVIATLPDDLTAGLSDNRIGLVISEIRSIAAGQIFGDPGPDMLAAAERLAAWSDIANYAMVVVGVCAALLGLGITQRRISPEFKARLGVEHVLSGLMITCSVIAIFTTIGITGSLIFEALRFFDRVPVHEFLFGLNWEPQIAIREDQVAGLGAFGAVPVFLGTMLVAMIAMAVAVPIGLLSAIYLAEYSGRHMRKIAKPILEMLAGVPTVVYGFFAVLVVAPALRDAGGMAGIDVAANSALAAGAVMGIMIIPFISSLSDDALNAVPRAMRDGAYALGATQAETVRQVLLPAALPGIVGGILLALSRAIGETMIVVMAAGLIAKLTVNPLESVTTVTVQIVTLLIGDTAFDNPKTLAAFALGLLLFLITLGLNVIALSIVRKYRERYE